MPYSSKISFIVSTNEWIASLNIDELLVHAAAPAFVMATRRLPASAAYTTVFEGDSAVTGQPSCSTFGATMFDSIILREAGIEPLLSIVFSHWT
ncbi:MAG: hypothetical protein ABI612_15250, partial [Betaproteobacteria bacterium]